MGNSSSTPDGEDVNHDDYEDPFDGIDTLGYRVLGVQPDSPAATAGLVSFLEFLVGANGKMLLGSGEALEPGQEYDDVDFPALLVEKKGQPIELREYTKCVCRVCSSAILHCFTIDRTQAVICLAHHLTRAASLRYHQLYGI
jgi:hypothetical protein